MPTFYILSIAVFIFTSLLTIFVLVLLNVYLDAKKWKNTSKVDSFAVSRQWPAGSEVRNTKDLFKAPLFDLTVVIPAYNESKRIPETLKKMFEFFTSQNWEGTVEFIVVDDGSKDNTFDIAVSCAKAQEFFTTSSFTFIVLALDKNQGKGAAVRTGVLHSRGRQILFADADGATEIEVKNNAFP